MRKVLKATKIHKDKSKYDKKKQRKKFKIDYTRSYIEN